MINRPESGVLEFAKVRERTVLKRLRSRYPLKLLNPIRSGPAAWVYMSSFGGGLVDGDEVNLSVTVGAGATAFLTTQASTKVYRSEGSAQQRLEASVGDDALLVVAPDPIVCYADAAYDQLQKFDLSKGASLLLVDWLTAGRVACGERWAFRRYTTRTEIMHQGRRVLLESPRLDRSDGPLAERFGRCNILALVVVWGPRLAHGAKKLLADITAAPVQKRADEWVSASPLGNHGVLVRLAGVSVEQVGLRLRNHLDFLTDILEDDPWIGKA